MMGRLLIAFTLCACITPPAAQSQPGQHADQHGHEPGKSSDQAANVEVAPGEVVKRGEPVGDAPAVKFADVLKEPQRYADKTLIVEGVVERVCQMQGCWMELAPEKGARGVRVNMKDHAFFVPFNAAGLRARVEGTFSLNVLSKADADHLEKEGASLRRNPDGTANEISFVATGVELRKE
jgi:hypothetical protein